MPSSTFRDQLFEMSPPWLRDDVGGTILKAFGTVLDALSDRTRQGVKLRFPEVGSPTALGYTGTDRDIERGPTQSDEGYAIQLRQAFDTWRNAGGGRTILTQLRLYFAPGNGPPMRLVSAQSIWHEINTTTGAVTKTDNSLAPNWVWGDSKWWRGWAIIDVTGLFAIDYWGLPGDWGDGGVWGSDMTEGEVIDLNAILRKWKPAHIWGQIILVFNSGLFEVADTSPPNPNGNGEDYTWRSLLLANFLNIMGP